MLDESVPVLELIECGFFFAFGISLCWIAHWMRRRWPRLTGGLILLGISAPIVAFPIFYTVEAVPVIAEEYVSLPVLYKFFAFVTGVLVGGKIVRWRQSKEPPIFVTREPYRAERERLWVDQLRAEQRRRGEYGAEMPRVRLVRSEPYGSN